MAGEFIYIGPLAVPADGGKRIYSCNEGNMTSWDGPIKKAVDGFKGLVSVVALAVTAQCLCLTSLCGHSAKQGW